jgi:hypothetical protein
MTMPGVEWRRILAGVSRESSGSLGGVSQESMEEYDR